MRDSFRAIPHVGAASRVFRGTETRVLRKQIHEFHDSVRCVFLFLRSVLRNFHSRQQIHRSRWTKRFGFLWNENNKSRSASSPQFRLPETIAVTEKQSRKRAYTDLSVYVDCQDIVKFVYGGSSGILCPKKASFFISFSKLESKSENQKTTGSIKFPQICKKFSDL